MSLVAPIICGVVHMLTRRTTRRYFLLRPDRDEQLQQLFLYCLAVASSKFGVLVHAVVVMSNHFHVVLTDVYGLLPDFKRELIRNVANATKVLRGWPEEVFCKPGRTHVELEGPAAILSKMAYVIANPVACGAVSRIEEWPGVKVLPGDVGTKVFRVRRPDRYFSATSTCWPEEAELRIVMPQALVEEHGSEDAAREALEREVARQCDEARAKLREERRPIGSRKSALHARITTRGKAWETFGALSPRFATGGCPEAAKRALSRMREFLSAYAECLARWRQGVRDMLWPYGTWAMRVYHGARCHDPP